MSLTLGEKLRQAREERGISISEVAEQTRISPHYLDSIENDDYRTLPGGIFNKGFVKSYAKYVGIDEQEALSDYSRLISSQEGGAISEEPKTYRPEVLTDDRASSSMVPTIIFAVIILGLMTWGILALVNYIQNQPSQPVANNNSASNTNSAANANTSATNTNAAAPVTSVNELKVAIKTSGANIELSYSQDDKSPVTATVTPDKPLELNAQQKVKINYYKTYGTIVQLTINGKTITAPSAPIPPKKNAIEYEINKENVVQILNSGQIPTGAAPAASANTNTAPR